MRNKVVSNITLGRLYIVVRAKGNDITPSPGQKRPDQELEGEQQLGRCKSMRGKMLSTTHPPVRRGSAQIR